jgi:DNA-binding LacI/PurR family transcriptional regulator
VSAPGFRRDAGALSMARLLDLPDPPDAVFCYNDPLALGALRTILERGLRVPEDVAIAGFDDSEDGRFSTPTLTTISQDKRQIARYAVDLIVSRLGGDTSPPVTRKADWRLITRESTLGRSRR